MTAFAACTESTPSSDTHGASSSSASSSASSSSSSSSSSSGLRPSHPVNDSGVNYCRNEFGEPQNCDEADWQDGNTGRDALAEQGLLGKVGAGAAGFDFTKLSADGQPLAIQNQPWRDGGSEADGSQWRCVRDNHTQLVWEVKSDNPDALHYAGFDYTWHNPDPAQNGGFEGYPGAEYCAESLCDTTAYVASVNEQRICGISEWRLPTVNELLSLVHSSRQDLAIDVDYFPNTQPSHYWSSQAYAPYKSHAWYVYFSDGSPSNTLKSTPMFLRLVHRNPHEAQR